MHALCVLLMENPNLLDLFTSPSSSSPSSPSEPRFLLFSLLTPFLHRPDSQGQLARDSLVLCVSLSSQHRPVACRQGRGYPALRRNCAQTHVSIKEEGTEELVRRTEAPPSSDQPGVYSTPEAAASLHEDPTLEALRSTPL